MPDRLHGLAVAIFPSAQLLRARRRERLCLRGVLW